MYNRSVKANLVSTCKKRQSCRRLLNQLDDFDRDIIIGNAASDKQENVVVNEGTVDEKLTVNIAGSNLLSNENLVNVKALERCFNEKIDKEMGNIIDTVKDRIQNAILNAIASIITPKIKLAVRSINVLWTSCEQCHSEFRTWGTHRDYCLFWKRILNEEHTTCVEYE